MSNLINKKQTYSIISSEHYHPFLRKQWTHQIKSYEINSRENHENFIDWDDPYKNIRLWTIIDFLREFKLTK